MSTKRLLRVGVLAALAAGGLGSSGCSTMNNTERGATVGGVGGAAVGTVIGAATNHPLAGALIGGLAGTAGGALVGNDVDRTEQRVKDVQQAQAVAAAQAQQQRMGLADVIHMAQQGHDDQIIVNQIRSTGSTFQLTVTDLEYLKNNGVSQRVIAEMQVARPAVRPPGTIYYEYPVAPPPPVIVAPRPYFYGGPVFVGGFGRHW